MKSFTPKTFSRAIRIIFQSILLSVFLTISACGGGGGGGNTGNNNGGMPPNPPTPPTSGVVIPAPNPSNGLNYRTAEFTMNYGLAAINSDAAYQRGYFGQGVTVAVVDTGFLTTHQELTGRVTQGRYFPVSDYSTVVTGVTLGDIPWLSEDGTGVAGVIAAARNGTVFHGVAPSATIMPLQTGLYGWRSTEAWEYAISNNVKIINNSFRSDWQSVVGRLSKDGPLYEIRVPYIHEINEHIGFYATLAMEYADVVRDEDVVIVWGAGDSSWQPETGMLEAERLDCKYRYGDISCHNEREFLSYSTVTANFISEEYVQRSITWSDEGTSYTISAVADFTNIDFSSGTSYDSGAPFWAVTNITELRQDVADGSLSPADFAAMVAQDSNFRAFNLRWLSVVGTDENNKIAEHSNGCGIALAWCLAAPGERIVTANSSLYRNNSYIDTHGIDAAAAHVSGALALLQSRFPNMPMQVLVAILLDTATDLGEEGVDLVYGHGLVNVSAAITYQGSVQIARTSGFSASSFNARTSRIVLPASMAGVKEQLGDAQVAFELPGGLYYNTPLSEFVDIQDAPKKSLGNAAAALLREETEGEVKSGMFFAGADSAGMLRYAGADVDGGAFGEWQVRRDFCDDCGNNAVWQEWQDAGDDVSAPASPFFAGGGQDRFLLQMRGEGVQPFAAFGKSSPDGDSAYQQFGLRWSGSVGEGFSLLAEASRVVEDEHFMGADWRAFGAVESRTWQGRFALRGEIATGWKSFLQFEVARSDVDVKDGGFLRGASGLRADGFLAGLERSDVLFGGDKLRLWAGQETALRSGKLHLRYPQAIGSFPAAFSGISKQTLKTTETDVELSGGASTILALGYAMRISDDSAAAFAIEKRGNESAVSGQFRFRF